MPEKVKVPLRISHFPLPLSLSLCNLPLIGHQCCDYRRLIDIVALSIWMIMRCRYRLPMLFVSLASPLPNCNCFRSMIDRSIGISFHFIFSGISGLSIFVFLVSISQLTWNVYGAFWSSNETFNKIGSYINSVIRVRFGSVRFVSVGQSTLLLKVKTQHLNFKKPLTKTTTTTAQWQL